MRVLAIGAHPDDIEITYRLVRALHKTCAFLVYLASCSVLLRQGVGRRYKIKNLKNRILTIFSFQNPVFCYFYIKKTAILILFLYQNYRPIVVRSTGICPLGRASKYGIITKKKRLYVGRISRVNLHINIWFANCTQHKKIAVSHEGFRYFWCGRQELRL